MKYYIGLDLGTSSCKGILCSADGGIIKEVSRTYDVSYPAKGWSEQSPDDWMDAVDEIIEEVTVGIKNDVYGLSIGGQMHGLVALDKDDRVIRPCILWNDGRTEKECEYLNCVVGKEKLSSLTGNIAFAGFTAPKLLWMKENEPENFASISKIMLPKDYVIYKLTGAHSSDFSDASGTLLLDVKNKCWSEEMCDICGIKKEWLPTLHESYDVVGKTKSKYLLENCIVTAGAGDNAAAAIGTGTVRSGSCNISLGTSGTIFICEDSFAQDKMNALHAFAHANGKWHLMGCILSAASNRKWWLEEIIGSDDYEKDEEEILNADVSDVVFFPYLSGERSPLNDASVRGAFIGLDASTTRGEMSRAIMEGVIFALRDCLDVGKENGVFPQSTTLCGGGAKSKVWCQIAADILNMPVKLPSTEQGPSYGAALLAMVGAGEYASVAEASEAITKVKEVILPRADFAAKYDKKYKLFKEKQGMLR